MNRSQRLRRPDQFQRVRRDGKSWSHSMLVLNAAPNGRRRTRCGFVAGKKIGKAVERNRVRRRLREAVRLSYGSIAFGWDLVFVVRTGAADASFAVLQEVVRLLLQRGGLWREPVVAAVEPQATV